MEKCIVETSAHKANNGIFVRPHNSRTWYTRVCVECKNADKFNRRYCTLYVKLEVQTSFRVNL